MKLESTIEMMTSEDYKERFKAEYAQLVIRYDKLSAMVYEMNHGDLDFTPTCPVSTYNAQLEAMSRYIAVLEARAVMEGIDLDDLAAAIAAGD
jgi:hypothetical protein